jgi:uncharacterized membrane protein
MESKAKLLGHPIHQMLVPIPFGSLATAVIFDLIYLVWAHNTTMITVSYWMIAAGIVGGLIAAPFGLIDYLAIPNGTRAKYVGMLHGLGNVVVLLMFAGSWYLRYSSPDPNNPNVHVPGTAALVLSFAGFLLAAVTGWLGGELVDRLGVGVDEGANVNALNSLVSSTATRRG